jgi:prepilin-type N-terminal cleavage/methylation domain-containing protein
VIGLQSERRHRDDAFTLLEILAVVAIFALIAGLAMPNFSALQSRNLKQQAERLVAQLELARQRSIVTGVPHRLYIDIDGSAYRIEWLASEKMVARDGDDMPSGGTNDLGGTNANLTGQDLAALLPGEAPTFEVNERAPIDLNAPVAEEASYQPILGTAGHLVLLDESTIFSGVETDGGWVDGGETWIRFERDGSADPTTIEIEHESGLSATLEILPLADSIRVAYETE